MLSYPQNLTGRRNYGIDLLRLITMFLVVNLHIMGHGGILSSATGNQYHAAFFIETVAYCAVDCFAIISGFVSYTETEKPYRYSKFLTFWLQVFTYSFGVTLLAFLLKPNSIGIESVIQSLFPITTGQYWYVTSYTGLFFIIPWLNKLIRACDNKEATRFITVILSVFVGYVTFANNWSDCFKLQNGYSFVWLSILYLVGAWLKKCDIPNRIPSLYFVFGSVICLVFSWCAHDFVSIPVFHIFVNYTSFTIVFIAISLVSVFSKLKVQSTPSQIISCFAPAAFGVYLVHEQPLVRKYFINSSFVWIADSPAWLIPIQILGSAFCIFVICLFIEKIRLVLFRLLRINQMTDFLEKKSEVLVNCIFDKVTSTI